MGTYLERGYGEEKLYSRVGEGGGRVIVCGAVERGIEGSAIQRGGRLGVGVTETRRQSGGYKEGEREGGRGMHDGGGGERMGGMQITNYELVQK